MTRLNPPDLKESPHKVMLDSLIEQCNAVMMLDSEAMFIEVILYGSSEIIKSSFTDEEQREIESRVRSMKARLEQVTKFKRTEEALMAILGDFRNRTAKKIKASPAAV